MIRKFLLMYLICLVAQFSFGRTIYVNNILGSDLNDGLCAESLDNNKGPLATISKAVSIIDSPCTLELVNTGKAYTESITFLRKSGTPSQPIVINGNNAVLNGLAEVNYDKFKNEGASLLSLEWPHNSGFSYWLGDKFMGFVPEGDTLTDYNSIKAGTAFLIKSKQKVVFRLNKNKDKNKFKIRAASLFCGVFIIDSSFIRINNLNVEGFINDGFNESGLCRGLEFNNITAAYNCDEGMSAHNSVSAVIYNANFHHNYNGIADTQYSNTSYYGVTVQDNFSYGILFQGGVHHVSNGYIANNAQGVIFEYLGDINAYNPAVNPLSESVGSLQNVFVTCSDRGLSVGAKCRVSADHITVTANRTGINLEQNSVMYLVNSICGFNSNSELTLVRSSRYAGGYNIWYPGKLLYENKIMNMDNWQDWKSCEGFSKIADPLLKNKCKPQLDVNSPAKNSVYISKLIMDWYITSGFCAEENYSELYPDIGADFTSKTDLLQASSK